tara:strand:+ start:141 stop:398 length:258 start_codon:yes stop_codon:yes gene_type:complete
MWINFENRLINVDKLSMVTKHVDQSRVEGELRIVYKLWLHESSKVLEQVECSDQQDLDYKFLWWLDQLTKHNLKHEGYEDIVSGP